MNIHEVLSEYIEQCPLINSFLRFNVSTDTIGNVSIASSYGAKWEKRYVRGHGIKRYDFALIFILPYDTGTSDVNIKEMFDSDKFIEWIELQNDNNNLPDFGENTHTLSIECLQNMPNLAGVSADGTAAKYMIQCRVRYQI